MLGRVTLIVLSALIIGCTRTPEVRTTDVPTGNVQEFADAPGLVKAEEIKSDTSKISTSGYYYNGKKSGTWTEYFATGRVKSITTYINGVKEGIFLELNESNYLVRRCFFHNDLRHGTYTVYIS